MERVCTLGKKNRGRVGIKACHFCGVRFLKRTWRALAARLLVFRHNSAIGCASAAQPLHSPPNSKGFQCNDHTYCQSLEVGRTAFPSLGRQQASCASEGYRFLNTYVSVSRSSVRESSWRIRVYRFRYFHDDVGTCEVAAINSDIVRV